MLKSSVVEYLNAVGAASSRSWQLCDDLTESMTEERAAVLAESRAILEALADRARNVTDDQMGSQLG